MSLSEAFSDSGSSEVFAAFSFSAAAKLSSARFTCTPARFRASFASRGGQFNAALTMETQVGGEMVPSRAATDSGLATKAASDSVVHRARLDQFQSVAGNLAASAGAGSRR
eukprot:CAMPEP_0197696546 /NCGR_PEP_ID=MMETSP1338-20131121/116760_1 /TAXON_ID=43686 ORGANISM="Pelagodinium beii, Strain RCC1491" /NCGR_SAMPLE_ID=MMETSP1338 /ASSEMBLY_ACC=CAM_ASM_000754 /LENGTH=110 /DNA_ID=CAMNT_0043279671 /DNA_START=208 /DNA_END=536 /DNA_ORIENTATION=-